MLPSPRSGSIIGQVGGWPPSTSSTSVTAGSRTSPDRPTGQPASIAGRAMRRRSLAAGIPPQPALVATGDYSFASGERLMRQLWRERPTAVFVAGDAMALGALRALSPPRRSRPRRSLPGRVRQSRLRALRHAGDHHRRLAGRQSGPGRRRAGAAAHATARGKGGAPAGDVAARPGDDGPTRGRRGVGGRFAQGEKGRGVRVMGHWLIGLSAIDLCSSTYRLADFPTYSTGRLLTCKGA